MEEALRSGKWNEVVWAEVVPVEMLKAAVTECAKILWAWARAVSSLALA